MLQRQHNHLLHMIVVKRIEYRLANLSALHDAHIPQQPQLMGHGRLAHMEHLRQVVNAELRLHERMNDFHPRRVAQRLEQISKLNGGRLINQLAAHTLYVRIRARACIIASGCPLIIHAHPTNPVSLDAYYIMLRLALLISRLVCGA